MACHGWRGDYLCDGWKRRARAIRRRDGNRCQDCRRLMRGLHVHHLYYGHESRRCGACVLLSVPDTALVSLCPSCHDIRHGRQRAPLNPKIVVIILILVMIAAMFFR